MDCQNEKRSSLISEGTTTIDFKPKLPKFYKWTPQEDITTLELAKCIPVFNIREINQLEMLIESLQESCRRHFTEVQ